MSNVFSGFTGRQWKLVQPGKTGITDHVAGVFSPKLCVVNFS